MFRLRLVRRGVPANKIMFVCAVRGTHMLNNVLSSLGINSRYEQHFEDIWTLPVSPDMKTILEIFGH